jgi:hypothetical protein
MATTADQKKVIVRRLIDEFWNKKNFNIVNELFAPGMVYHKWDFAADSRSSRVV